MAGDKGQAWERWNTHFSTCVEQEVLGVTLRLAQDPNSEHLGTTVWDASIVMAKYFEKNVRKGEFSRVKVKGKRAIELGAGMGLGGLALAMLGADVVLTDVKEVLPLLRRNYETNLSPAVCRGRDDGLAACMGRVQVQELDWCNPKHWEDVQPPFDYVLAADCIYHEHLLQHLHRTVLAMTHERSTILIVNERRSESVQSTFMELFSPSFAMRKVPLSKMDPVHQHPAIEMYLMKRKKGAGVPNVVTPGEPGAEGVNEVISGLHELATSAQEQGQHGRQAAGGTEGQARTAGPNSGATDATGSVQAAGERGAGQAGCRRGAEHNAGTVRSSTAGDCQLQRTGDGDCSSGCSGRSSHPAAGAAATERCGAGAAGSAQAAGHSSDTVSQQTSSNKPEHGSAVYEQQHPRPVSSSKGQATAGPAPDWEMRRQGAMAARLLAGVQVPRLSHVISDAHGATPACVQSADQPGL